MSSGSMHGVKSHLDQEIVELLENQLPEGCACASAFDSALRAGSRLTKDDAMPLDQAADRAHGGPHPCLEPARSCHRYCVPAQIVTAASVKKRTGTSWMPGSLIGIPQTAHLQDLGAGEA